MERLHKVIYDVLVNKGLNNKTFDYIDPQFESLLSLAWVIRYSYCRHLNFTSSQAYFARDMIFIIASTVDCNIIAAVKQQQVSIYNALQKRHISQT